MEIKRPGRPVAEDPERGRKRRIRFDVAFDQQVSAAAESAGLSVEAWVRRACAEKLGRDAPPAPAAKRVRRKQ